MLNIITFALISTLELLITTPALTKSTAYELYG